MKPVDQKALLAVIGRELQLCWEMAEDVAHTGADHLAALPRQAEELVRRLRQFAEVGHIRAVEAALDQLEADVPDSAATVAAMRDHVGNFDLRSLMKMLDGIRFQ
jgi:Holliday junction resolvasome RuvABC ATP-dependent DNA helicase subunit